MTARISQITKLGVLSAASLLAVTTSARANELFSESVFVPPVATVFSRPVNGWDKFNILVSGNPVLPTQNAADPNTDPFAVNGTSTITTGNPFTPLDTDVVDPVGPGAVTLPGLTRVTFSGSTNINERNIPNQNLDNPVNQVQFGLTGPANNAVMDILAQHWQGGYTFGAPDGGENPGFIIGGGIGGIGSVGNFLRGVPVVSVTPNPAPPSVAPPGQSFKYIVDFIQFTEDGISGSEWVEFPYLPSQQPTFTYAGWADIFNPIHFASTEIQLSDTQIPLDDLNFADDPLTGGLSTPAFVQVANAPDVVPEPGSAALFLAAAIIASSIRRRAQR